MPYKTKVTDVDTGAPLKWNGSAWVDDTGGSGDMTKAVYDPNADGLIAAAQLTGVPSFPLAQSDVTNLVTDLSGKTTLTAVKADSDIADALSKKHANTLDHANSLDHSNSLDHNGGTQDTAISGKEPANANIQAHVISAHAPSNAQANADITKAEIEAKLTGTISSHSHTGGGSFQFPVGAIYTETTGVNPATTFGYGTWSAFGTGRILIGLDSGDADFDVVEETGGAKTKTIAQANLPNISTGAGTSHNHTQDAHNHTQNAHTHDFLPRSGTTGSVSSIVTGTLDTSSTISGANQPHVQNQTATNIAQTATNQAEAAHTHSLGGSGTALNIMPPTIVVYMWKRTV